MTFPSNVVTVLEYHSCLFLSERKKKIPQLCRDVIDGTFIQCLEPPAQTGLRHSWLWVIHIRPSAVQPRFKQFKFVQCSHMNFVLILRQNEKHSARLKSGVRLINNTLIVWPRSLSAASNLPFSSSSCRSGKTRIIRAAISLLFQTFRFKSHQMHS